MPILTKGKLADVTKNRIGVKAFSFKLNEAKSQSRSTAQKSIFLSHSHEDLKDGTVGEAIVFLRNLGINIYIDSNDSALPPTTSAQTAILLKNRIQICDKFVLLATNISIASKWCNWELGLGDAHKYINKIALLPLSENNNVWNGNEYLKIYPRIEESAYTTDYYKVIYPDGKEMSIGEWLKL